MELSEGGKWDNCNSIINKYIKKSLSSINVYLIIMPCCLINMSRDIV